MLFLARSRPQQDNTMTNTALALDSKAPQTVTDPREVRTNLIATVGLGVSDFVYRIFA